MSLYYPRNENGKWAFRVWAPDRERVELCVLSPESRRLDMQKNTEGYWSLTCEGLAPGCRYTYCLDGGTDFPDPCSSFQPEGVHGASELVDHAAFPWADSGWTGIPLPDAVIYELHTGTFTPEGTFDAAIARLPDLKALGITAVEVMPVAQFPGTRNWGYDGAAPYAVQNSYGGPDGFKRFVDACHGLGLAVILDVVYNHLGPEGNYLGQFGPYFTDRYQTPWGAAVNFDGAQSGPVRDYFIQNALFWFTHYHIDGLRLDAVHGIYDLGARHILKELADEVRELKTALGREIFLIAESDLNDTRLLHAPEQGGHGLDAQWSDDFHHALHVLLTGEQNGYYADFGEPRHLLKALNEGFVYSWDYSRFRRRRHGNPSGDIPCRQLVVCSQNHDQVGNRMKGDRLSTLVPFEAAKLAAGCVILSPYLPLIFMGEEYGEKRPFPYFVSHGDEALIRAVRDGRRQEFAGFGWKPEEVPDPQGEEVFRSAVLDWESRGCGEHQAMLHWNTELIRLRRVSGAFRDVRRENVQASLLSEKVIRMTVRHQGKQWMIFFNLKNTPLSVSIEPDRFPAPALKRLDSAQSVFSGPGPSAADRLGPGQEAVLQPFNVVVYESEASS